MTSWLDLAARRQPERVALEAASGTRTYAELSAEASDGVRALQAAGVRAGDRVALALADRLDFVVALHACLLAGTPAVPIDLRLGDAEQAQRAADARLVVREALGCGGAGPVALRGTSLDAVATVMHTSGTTAAPKPVALTYGNWLANALGSAVALGLDTDERWLCPMPLAHVGGLSILVRSAIYASTVVAHERFDTEAVLNELIDPGRRITLVSLVPTMLTRLLDAGLANPPTLRWALLGGAPIAPALLQRARAAGVPVAPTYGMTEACSQIATFGWPLPGVELRLSEPEGEILVRGPIVAPGAVSEDGWLHTGDLGRFDAAGRLGITGRWADTIVTGGENVAPTEVEAVLLAHPGVADAGVFARPDPQWGEAVVATVVLREGCTPGAPELQEFCRAKLGPFKVPKVISFSDSLPRTASGKLVRRELRR